MFKFILSFAAVIVICYFGMSFYGYELRAENLAYYVPQKPESGSNKNMMTHYFDSIKSQSKTHPLIAKKKGASAAGKLDQGSTETLKQLMQVDKLQQLEKLKKDIKDIQAKSDERGQQLENIMEGKY